MGKELKSLNIVGVCVCPLTQIPDERGAVLHMLRNSSEEGLRFGEIYFSEINPGVVKAWKRHHKITQHLAVPVGRIRLVLYDGREHSATAGNIQEIQIGRPDAYVLVTIPTGIWYGFGNLAGIPSLVSNFIDFPYDPHETETIEMCSQSIPYSWDTN